MSKLLTEAILDYLDGSLVVLVVFQDLKVKATSRNGHPKT